MAGFGIYVPCPDSQGDATRDAQPSYKAWKGEALKVLQRDHNLPPTAISEREWTQLYVHGFTPDQAADRAVREYRQHEAPSRGNEK